MEKKKNKKQYNLPFDIKAVGIISRGEEDRNFGGGKIMNKKNVGREEYQVVGNYTPVFWLTISDWLTNNHL